jgi:hypothetical protein
MGEAKRRRQQFRRVPVPCIYCGIRPGTTRDHVPPKSLFLPRLRTTVTVPACVECNTGSSKEEDEFRVFMSVKDGRDTPESLKLWKDGALHSVRNNQRMHRKLLSGGQLLLRSPSTGKFEPRHLFTWNLAESHHPVIRKITRGLYYHNFKCSLSAQTTIDVTYLPKLTPEMIDFCYQNMAPGDTGGDPRFVYAYLRNDEYPTHSIWIFQFYRRHWASAFTDFTGHR